LVILVAQSSFAAILRYKTWAAQNNGSPTNADDTTARITIPYLTVVPSLSIIYPWVFITATFVEQNVFSLLGTGAVIFYGGKYLERAWSTAEFAKFILLVSLGPNVLATAWFLSLFALTGNASLSYDFYSSAFDVHTMR
jgi:membrane associated rhomboid family serine protease